uniref:Uncharacterized protein n=1 Tax=Rhizophora mucronata TaxID=61149 RepID=A0A2P2QRY9_RHIMU
MFVILGERNLLGSQHYTEIYFKLSYHLFRFCMMLHVVTLPCYRVAYLCTYVVK